MEDLTDDMEPVALDVQVMNTLLAQQQTKA
jgi:hypothetical protein